MCAECVNLDVDHYRAEGRVACAVPGRHEGVHGHIATVHGRDVSVPSPSSPLFLLSTSLYAVQLDRMC